MAPARGWFNLEAGAGAIPDSAFFEGEPSFQFLNLSKTTRLYGFAGCFIAGFAFSLLGAILLSFGFFFSFAACYVIGTIISLVGTGFIIGFFRQLKLMFKPVRIVAAVVFIASIALVLVGAFAIRNSILCLVFVIVEFLAYAWYVLSYIPYARDAVSKMVGF